MSFIQHTYDIDMYDMSYLHICSRSKFQSTERQESAKERSLERSLVTHIRGRDSDSGERNGKGPNQKHCNTRTNIHIRYKDSKGQKQELLTVYNKDRNNRE